MALDDFNQAEKPKAHTKEKKTHKTPRVMFCDSRMSQFGRSAPIFCIVPFLVAFVMVSVMVLYFPAWFKLNINEGHPKVCAFKSGTFDLSSVLSSASLY